MCYLWIILPHAARRAVASATPPPPPRTLRAACSRVKIKDSTYTSVGSAAATKSNLATISLRSVRPGSCRSKTCGKAWAPFASGDTRAALVFDETRKRGRFRLSSRVPGSDKRSHLHRGGKNGRGWGRRKRRGECTFFIYLLCLSTSFGGGFGVGDKPRVPILVAGRCMACERSLARGGTYKVQRLLGLIKLDKYIRLHATFHIP